MRGIIITIIATAGLLHAGNLYSEPDSVKYSPDFEFVEGIYLTFEEFKNNDPSIKQEAVIRDTPTDQLLFGDLFNHEKITYFGPGGEVVKLKKKTVWGYSSGKNVFIRKGMYFNRIFKIGYIMHFMEQYNNPVDNRNRGDSPLIYVASLPYMVDYKTGDVLNYCYENFLKLLERDQELYNEFTAIKKYKKRVEQMFLYLMKFNEKHPIYFPVH